MRRVSGYWPRVIGSVISAGVISGPRRRRLQRYCDLRPDGQVDRTLIATMAHEMIQPCQDENGAARGIIIPQFRRLAKQVCILHGFTNLNSDAGAKSARARNVRRPVLL
jgi:hypothetical protein